MSEHLTWEELVAEAKELTKLPQIETTILVDATTHQEQRLQKHIVLLEDKITIMTKEAIITEAERFLIEMAMGLAEYWWVLGPQWPRGGIHEIALNNAAKTVRKEQINDVTKRNGNNCT